MGTVTSYDMAGIQSALGGSNPISLSEYYRGGPYVPTSRTVTTRDPTSGEYYNAANWFWRNYIGVGSNVYWNGAGGFFVTPTAPVGATSLVYNGWTYYRGSLRSSDPSYGIYLYGVYRDQSSTVSINTGVPSSGTIAISQLYGAQNP